MPKYIRLGSTVDAPFVGAATVTAHYPAHGDDEEFFTVRRIADGALFQCPGWLLSSWRQTEWRKFQASAEWLEHVARNPAAAIAA